MKEIFPSAYMTTLAIIQGVALGFLLSTAQADWLHNSDARYRVMIGMQALAVFTIVVVVTHRYMYLIGLTRWRALTGFDVLIPFILGVGEIGAAQLIGRSVPWWSAILFFSFAAIVVYLHSRRQSKTETVDLNRQFRTNTSRAIWLLTLIALSSILAIVHDMLESSAWFDALSPMTVVVILLVLESIGHYKFAASRPEDADNARTERLTH